jgi:CRISPR-associated endonuclease/helicase Cas3
LEETPFLGSLRGKSHPEKMLIDHLRGVERIFGEMVHWHGFDLDPKEIELLSLSHDIAKEHTLFQKHLSNPKVRYNHAGPSSYFTFLYSEDIFLTELVRNHHGQFQNIDAVRNFWFTRDIDDISATMEAVLPHQQLSEAQYQNLLDGLLQAKWNEEDWYRTRLLASLLTTADRMDAMNLEPFHYAKPERKLTYEQMTDDLPPADISGWRKQLARAVINKVNVMENGGIYTLSLPTGAGKTLLGIETALRMFPRTIIYCLPFISIVDQVAEIAQNLFPKVQQDHHLIERENAFIQAYRYWNEPVVVTTFAHFWEILYSPRMNDTMNFHRLKDAFVILDEVRSIPPDYWAGFGKTLRFIAKKMNTTILLMTATQPEITKGIELAPSNPTQDAPNRYQVKRVGKAPLETLRTLLPKNGSGLIILNTRQSALKAYQIISREEEDRKLFFLSRWVTPSNRSQRLKTVKQCLEEGTECLLIATQVVEAGIDMDFEWVIRDLAPLDCIIQAAGRCNRNRKVPFGYVYVPEFLTDKEHPFTSYVYDSCLLSATRKTLPEGFTEKESAFLIRKYYQELNQAVTQTGAWYDITTGNWGNRHSLIRKEIPEALVLIETDGSVSGLFEQIRTLSKDYQSLDKRKKLWNRLQHHAIEVPGALMQEWIRETNSFLIDDSRPAVEELEEGVYIVHPQGLGNIYSKDTGFIVPHSSSEEGQYE